WRQVPPLPFELAALPHQFYGALQLPVVSYALPALIAIGQARFHHCPPRNPIIKALRRSAIQRTLRLLTEIQPENGGFLEATPLTSFVLMSLASMGLSNHPVARRAAKFLSASVRPDGSWPIDTNLSTWLTTLAINSLVEHCHTTLGKEAGTLATLLLNEQYKVEHPYTHASPGGWAWTELPGGLPDADDTAGAVLALSHLKECSSRAKEAAMDGLCWLMGVQNRDGGIPTFCRGWGALPFDRSSPDISAHFIRAAQAWLPHLEPHFAAQLRKRVSKATHYLIRQQRPDGSWLPLWFGNQWCHDDENALYGTSRVLMALSSIDDPSVISAVDKGLQWIASAQNEDGGWGGGRLSPSSVEEAALAVEALAVVLNHSSISISARGICLPALRKGVEFLVRKVESGEWTQPSPIGFYFAKLWYYERLYPVVFTSAALRAARNALSNHAEQKRQIA
ncbi:MAG: prenyltransferase/squalene oxidase repeat-containing protein, partial [Limisphaerales bacterium]